jgi:hypothetical protein
MFDILPSKCIIIRAKDVKNSELTHLGKWEKRMTGVF